MYTVDVRILRSRDPDAADAADAADDGEADGADVGGAALVESWRISRRFSQFAELHDELTARYAAELLRCGARLPSKFRLPSSLAVEGDERAPALDAYLHALLTSSTIRESEQLMYFVAAGTSRRRRVWDAAVPTPQPIFEIAL